MGTFLKTAQLEDDNLEIKAEKIVCLAEPCMSMPVAKVKVTFAKICKIIVNANFKQEFSNVNAAFLLLGYRWNDEY